MTAVRRRGGERAFVIGYGVSGRAAASWLVSQGFEVVVLEDDLEAGRAAETAAVRAA